MRRREFIALLGGAAAWPLLRPLVAWAELPKQRIIGFMGASTAAAVSTWVAAFERRLIELTEGRNVRIEYRWADGRFDRLAGFAGEFVRENVDVIVAEGTVTTLAAKKETSAIPIVFPIAGDPVGNNLVGSLARPGGNVTGF